MSLKLLAVGLVFAMLILATVVRLIRKGSIAEEYASIWLGVGLMIIIGVVAAKPVLNLYASLKGEPEAGPEVLLFFALLFLLFFLLLLSVRLTRLEQSRVRMAQEIGALKLRLEQTARAASHHGQD